MSDSHKLRFLTYILGSGTWIALTSASSARIILRQLAPLDQTLYHLQCRSFVKRSIFSGINIGNNSVESLYPGKNLKPFLRRISETSGLSWILSGVISNEMLSTN